VGVAAGAGAGSGVVSFAAGFSSGRFLGVLTLFFSTGAGAVSPRRFKLKKRLNRKIKAKSIPNLLSIFTGVTP
jgi:hypothetical protein